MNLAFVEGVARYHTPGDNPANLSAASLQHHGWSMLALAAALAELAVLALAVLALAVWGLLLRRRVGAWALGLGAAVWLAVLGIVTAVLVPGMSFLVALPALGLGAGALVAVALRGAARPVVLAVGAVPLVVLVVPFVLGLLDAAGVSGAALPAAAAVLLGAPLAVIVAGIPVRWSAALVPLVAAVALAGAGLVVDRPGPAHPQQAGLAYLLDADAGTAHWISRDLAPALWTAQFVPAGPDEPGPALPWAGAERIRFGPAPVLALPAPAVTPRPRTDGAVEMTVTSRRGARTLGVRSDVGILEVEVTLAGLAPVTLPLAGQPADLLIGDLPADGVRLLLRPAAPGPVRLDVRDETVGLESVPGYVPRPPELSRSSFPDGDAVVATTSVLP